MPLVKMVAEPWDVGQMDSYDLGRFPSLWREWNGKYRDSMRDFWRSHPVGIGAIADRFAGSADLLRDGEPRPTSSVNFITVHDGFTLRDLVSYDDKHNEANGEDNRDGTSDNNSWNCGAEGPTTDPAILALARRGSPAPCSPRSCCPSECRCCSAVTRWAGRSRATTTPTARTTS